ncbi:MAG: SMC-Scp complex subunit ScpB [Candidatus Pacearchaeota archaeon]
MDLTKETQEEIDNLRELENMKRVEAALFISAKFLSVQELVALTDLNPILLERSLLQLADKYGDDSAIEVIKKGDLWKMDVKNEYRDIVNRLATGNDEFTKAEQETLAIIAYKQPITQSKIIHIRGNKAYDHIKKFIDLGLVVSKRKGRTYELSLSNDFYDYFSIKEKEKIFKSNEENNEKSLKITKKEAVENTGE